MDMLTYEAAFPGVPAGTDVAKQVFVATANGVDVKNEELEASAVSATFEVEQGANVSLSLVYVDDAGNRSAARTQDFVATDTIAPEAPGEFGAVTLISERTV
jgi:hypothetical protein